MQKLFSFFKESLFLSYKIYLRPIFGNACRYEPTCSCYAKEAFEKHDLFTSFFLILYRVLRCQPFSSGGYDPVPLKKEITHG